MRSYLILGMCTLFLLQYFTQGHWLQYIVVIMSLIAFFGSAVKADRFPRWLGIVMMTAGLLIEWNKGTGVDGISEGIFLILPLLCLITFAPLLSIPLKVGGYFESVSILLHELIRKPKQFYAGITGTLFLLSPILNLGSVRITNEFLAELKLPSAVSAKSYLVGFSTAVMWSPYFASVSLVLHYLDVRYKEYIIYGMGLSVLSLLIGNLLFAFWHRNNPMKIDSPIEVRLEKNHRNQLIKLALIVVSLMGSCLFIESVTHWSMMVIVSLISLLLPLLFAIATMDWKRIKPLLTDYRDRTVPMMNNEIMLFMSAGMLAFAVKGTSVANGISSLLTDLAHQSFLLFALGVMVLVLSITYVGIHQIAAVGGLAMQLNAVDLGISNIALAMLLLLSWSISTCLSPFSGLNLMVSRFAGISGVQTGLRANGVFLTLFAFIGIAIISLVV